VEQYEGAALDASRAEGSGIVALRNIGRELRDVIKAMEIKVIPFFTIALCTLNFFWNNSI